MSRQASKSDFRHQLRSVTRAAHLRLEAEVDFEGRLTSLEAYRSLLEGFFRFLKPVEAALEALDLRELGIDYWLRRKLGWVEADLEDLGHSAASLNRLPEFSAAPKLRDPLEALGALYVLEGSSLGRQVMLGKLAPRLNVGPDWAGRFFNGYGKDTGAMWGSFVAVLNEAGSAPHSAQLIEAAALATFNAFEECIAETCWKGAEPTALKH